MTQWWIKSGLIWLQAVLLCRVLLCDDIGFVSLRIVLCILAGRGWVLLNLDDLEFSDNNENIPNIYYQMLGFLNEVQKSCNPGMVFSFPVRTCCNKTLQGEMPPSSEVTIKAVCSPDSFTHRQSPNQTAPSVTISALPQSWLCQEGTEFKIQPMHFPFQRVLWAAQEGLLIVYPNVFWQSLSHIPPRWHSTQGCLLSLLVGCYPRRLFCPCSSQNDP